MYLLSLRKCTIPLVCYWSVPNSECVQYPYGTDQYYIQKVCNIPRMVLISNKKKVCNTPMELISITLRMCATPLWYWSVLSSECVQHPYGTDHYIIPNSVLGDFTYSIALTRIAIDIPLLTRIAVYDLWPLWPDSLWPTFSFSWYSRKMWICDTRDLLCKT